MRSGRAYLAKRPPAGRGTGFEQRELRVVFPPAPAVREERDVEPEQILHTPPQIHTDLDENRWSVVSFNGVEAGGLTYDQAARLMDVLGENEIHGLCIITDAAALNID